MLDIIEDSGYVARELSLIHDVLVATPHYLDVNGSPSSPTDSKRHRCIVWNRWSERTTWEFSNGVKKSQIKVEDCLNTNDLELAYSTTLHGNAIALLPLLQCQTDLDKGRLIQLMPNWATPERSLFMIYPSNRFQPSKLQTFIDFMTYAFSH